ncbi:MAG: PIN domain-containing protein [Acidobacteria bacterium]|nr:PIN domain-containing protein [Acidobacteriota bacterium]MBV9477604.1 PIN domain-containing protein [Acidobacteriota bacterium]
MATGVAADATVVVAALVSWHERHRAACAALESALARKALVLPAPVLVESYAILTSLPAQHRLGHPEAFHLLRSNFSSARVVGPRTRDAWSQLRRWSVDAIGGGDAYDAALVDAAIEAGAKTLLTFRVKELERVAGTAIELVEPV